MPYSLIEHDPVSLGALAGLLALGLLGFFVARRWPWTAWLSASGVLLRGSQLADALAGMWTTDVHPDVTRQIGTPQLNFRRSPATCISVPMILPDADSLREQYPALWQLFGAYFHQDWHLDDDTPDDVLRRYLHDDPGDAITAARRELDEVLRRWPAEADLQEIHYRLGSSLWSPGVGFTTRGWLVHVREFLARDG